ncbi:hypothetical protein B0H14DRAFT_3529455 [Mycena olivaceomarginata]|nr:hypothetical protein B0H14DRAFT_3529455 [Mycena olivaceomarginata]
MSLYAVVLEQTERTRKQSREEIEHLIRESGSKITSLESQISVLVELRDRERTCVAALKYIISHPFGTSRTYSEYRRAAQIGSRSAHSLVTISDDLYTPLSLVGRLAECRLDSFEGLDL